MNYIALHLDGNELKRVLIQKDKNNFKILKKETLSSNVKPLDITPKNSSYTLVTGIDSWNLFLREFSFTLRFKRQILSILPFQIESQFPYPQNELILSPIFYKNGANTTVSLFAVTQEQLKQHLHYFQHLKFDPDLVSSTPHALLRYATHFFKDYPSTIVYHLGQEKSSYIVISEGKILLSQTENFGASSTSLESFEKDLERVCSYIRKKCPSIQKLILTGESYDHLPFLAKVFSSHFTLLESKEKYALPIGLCLDALKQDQKSLQLRTGPFIAARRATKRKARIKTYLIAAACLFLFTCIGGQYCLKKKEKEALAEFSAIFPIAKERSLEDALADFELSLSKNKVPFSFSLTVPRVSDTLAWLSSHPKLQSKEDSIEISHIRYQLMKYPQLDSPSAPYEARVELEFSTSSPRIAREFHESLLKGDPFINTKKEIPWNAHQDKYRTSFYLNPLKVKKAQ